MYTRKRDIQEKDYEFVSEETDLYVFMDFVCERERHERIIYVTVHKEQNLYVFPDRKKYMKENAMFVFVKKQIFMLPLHPEERNGMLYEYPLNKEEFTLLFRCLCGHGIL